MNSIHNRDVLPDKQPPFGGYCLILLCCLTLVSVFTATDTQAAKGSSGPFAKLSGTVTNDLTGTGVAGATVTFTNTSSTVVLTTNADGYFEAQGKIKVQVGNYTMEVNADYFDPYSQAVSLNKGTTVINVALDPVAPVIVDASVSDTASPGAVLNATGSYMIMDGSTFISSGWSQTPDHGVQATISDPASDTPTITLGSTDEYAAHLINTLTLAPISEDDLPPDIKLQPLNEVRKGLQDRNQVVPINPFALERTEEVPLTYTVTTTSGSYSAEVDVATHLPWVVNTGLKTVPVNVPVLLLARCDEVRDAVTGEYSCTSPTTFSWTITQMPDGSSATLTGADSRHPWFTPDVAGVYRIQETNGSGADLMVHAGRYHGVIDPILTLNALQFGDGRPVGDANCTSCHDGNAAPDKFTTWRQTGHAEAFSQGIDTNEHFGERCFSCHAVGVERDNAGGLDNTPGYNDFLNLLISNQAAHDTADTWETMLMDMPDTARLSNIQCENCHGPQDYTHAHRDQPGAPRVSVSADVCGSCHGEPERHGRFQQWLLSSHADYDLARERGASSGNCARCHSGNGFIAWDDHDYDPGQTVAVTWNEDTVHPQTCPTCHDPHDTGTYSGSDDTDAKVRIMGDTHELIAGFTATGVGKGATCMTCHNSRNGERNDITWASLSPDSKADIPHHGVQADLIMGQNAYFFDQTELIRGKHSLIEDVCVTCHMNKTQPPDLLSYNQQGTNHTFAADPGICIECHGEGVTADSVQNIVNSDLDVLKADISHTYMDLMNSHYPVNVPGCGVADATNPVTDVVWVPGFHDHVDVTLQDNSTCGPGPEEITVDSGAQTLQELSVSYNDGVVLKAIWNWMLVYEDEGRGVHNPDFTIKILNRSTAALSP